MGGTRADEIWSCQLGVAVEAMNKIGAGASIFAAIGITNQRDSNRVGQEYGRADLSRDRMASAEERPSIAIR